MSQGHRRHPARAYTTMIGHAHAAAVQGLAYNSGAVTTVSLRAA